MKKNKLSLIICVSLIAFSQASVTKADGEKLISDKNGLGVDKGDFDLLLKPASPENQLKLLKDRKDIVEKARQIYLTKAIGSSVKEQGGLLPEIQAELKIAVDLLYFQAKIKQLTTENLPDFESLAKKEYGANKEKYMEPEKVAVEHIMIDNRKHGEEAALKLADDIKQQLSKGADFIKLAEKYSEDPSFKTNHGKLEAFPKGGMIPEFDSVAFALKMGEVSDVIKTAYGAHIIRKYEHKKPEPKAYASVKDEIVAKIKKEYLDSRLNEYYEKIAQQNQMKVDDKAMDDYLAQKALQLKALVAAQPVKADVSGGDVKKDALAK